MPVADWELPVTYALLAGNSICSHAVNPDYSAADALRVLARRISPFLGGDFAPSPPPALLATITDGLLVVAWDAIAAVVAEAQPRLSGKAHLRLLGWTLADARGAQIAMDKALAETVGKRLERQAERVRPALAAAAEAAAAAADAARAAHATDPEMTDEHTRQLLSAECAAADAYERLRNEVYVGFHELNALIAPAEDVAASTEGEGQEQRQSPARFKMDCTSSARHLESQLIRTGCYSVPLTTSSHWKGGWMANACGAACAVDYGACPRRWASRRGRSARC